MDGSTGPWTFEGSVASLGAPGETVTLVEETTFCVCSGSGDIALGGPQGLVLLETRFLSRLELRVDGLCVQPLGTALDEPFAATFYGRVVPEGAGADVPLVVVRRRGIGRGLVEEVRLENHGMEPLESLVQVAVHADFADLFEVKEQRPVRSRVVRVETEDGTLNIVGERDGHHRATTVRPEPHASVELRGGAGLVTWDVALAPQASVSLCLDVQCSMDGEPIEPRHRCGTDETVSEPVRRLGEWRASVPHLHTDDDRLERAVAQGVEDLGALRLVDPDHPDDPAIAAGAPWFMTLFGRDSLIAAYMALIVSPDLALGVLRSLARLQGSRTDPDTEEEPGRILHELRFDRRPSWRFADATRYYGSVDSTALFVLLLGELRRWGGYEDDMAELMPAADAAVRWLCDIGDRDGDGFVEYQRTSRRGLANQGWKDSWDAVRHADGRLAEGPIALCEVQGYTYAALLARAYFAEEARDLDTAVRLRRRAAALREAFHERFWVQDDRGGFVALALDGDKVPVEVVTSNMGHCLWTGILDPALAPQVADRLLAGDMFSGWGVRTLSTDAPAYNPVSYHNGSVWPHDNALVVAGLMRYGLVDHAHRVIDALLDLSVHHDGRLPELVAGTARSELSVPAAYPTSCEPQAWAAASPLLLLRSLLRLDPWFGRRELWVEPTPLPGMSELWVEGLRLGGRKVSIEGDGSMHGLDADVAVHRHPRQPQTRSLEGP